MKTLSLALVMVVGLAGLVACGGNNAGTVDASFGGGDDAPAQVDAPVSSTCGNGVVDGSEQCDETSPCCVNCMFAAFNTTCRAASGACDVPEVCTGMSAACPADVDAPDGTVCTGGFCHNGACGACSVNIDADFDGANQCDDCDDTNGLAFPQPHEHACDGVDDDCDGKIDEDYDLDHDGYSTCSTDPLVADCDDTQATTHPGAPELCGSAGTGDGRDNNCNGYIDETCMPCDAVDHDGDGLSQCQGDCDDTRATVGPGKPEACDGFDTDCNKFTVENCGVSDACHFATNDDICKQDLQCGCILDATGACTGNYRCASFCESSYTGAIGAGCTATQTCLYQWVDSDNQHACAETTATLGTKLGGAVCAADTECRSGSCGNLCTGTDPACAIKHCIDFCDHDAANAAGSCATGTVCEIVSMSLVASTFMYATCELDTNGAAGLGQACSSTVACKWGPDACVNGVCAPPCGDDSQCPASYHCSLRGKSVTTGVWGSGLPVGVTGQPAIETVPVCIADGAGTHDHPGGAACTANGQCASELCDATLHVCVDPCVSDASCALGLTCEPLYIRPTPVAGSGIFWGRACVNGSFGQLLQSM